MLRHATATATHTTGNDIIKDACCPMDTIAFVNKPTGVGIPRLQAGKEVNRKHREIRKMLKIEKTLKELRDLQNTLHDLGIEMSIKDADAETKSDYEDAAMTINVYEPCRCFAWVGMDGVIHMRWNSYPDAFAWFRMNLLLDLARGYMLKADNITKSWTHLRRNLDGQDAEMPLPDKLAGRKAEYEDAANRLRDLIKADPIAMDLSPYECERLERFLRDPQRSVFWSMTRTTRFIGICSTGA